MFSWKAVLPGIGMMVILGLFMQLLLAVTPVLYNWLLGGSMFSSGHKDTVFYGVGLMGFALTFICGGFFTAYLSQRSVYLNSSIAAGVVLAVSLLFSRSGGELTLFSVSFFIIGILLTVIGAYLWHRKMP